MSTPGELAPVSQKQAWSADDEVSALFERREQPVRELADQAAAVAAAA